MTQAPVSSKPPDFNRIGVNYRLPMPRPKVRGIVIDSHTHLLAARHAREWFQTGAHFGIDCYFTMTPLEEALAVERMFPGRCHFIAIPRWGDTSPTWADEWLRRIDAFYNLGSRIVKFHMAPGSIHRHKRRLDSPEMLRIVRHAAARGMIIMTHIGDPETWYHGKYADASVYGSRQEHYRMWENVLEEFKHHPWLGAHLGGNPENPVYLSQLLDRYPNLYLDLSATRWMVREVSARRDALRDLIIRHQDRMLWGSDQVSGDDRGFDFLASRFWCHRKLWETGYIGPSPILDPDLPEEAQPQLRGLALPDEVLQKIYHDNPLKLLGRVGATLGAWR